MCSKYSYQKYMSKYIKYFTVYRSISSNTSANKTINIHVRLSTCDIEQYVDRDFYWCFTRGEAPGDLHDLSGGFHTMASFYGRSS